MIEVLTKLAEGECRNCGAAIAQYKGDLTVDPWWSHVTSGEKFCSGAPMAEPVVEHERCFVVPGVHAQDCPLAFS